MIVSTVVAQRRALLILALTVMLGGSRFITETWAAGAFAIGKGRLPFTILAIERQNPVASLQAQHVTKIMRLRSLESDLRIGLQRAGDVEPGASKVVLGQRSGP